MIGAIVIYIAIIGLAVGLIAAAFIMDGRNKKDESSKRKDS